MSSFYGGKLGRTYHIVLRYDSVNDMVEAFSQGGAYTDANYGLYVIIDTVLNSGRSSNMENGLLYRRGFDYNDSGIDKPIKSSELTDLEFLQRWSEYVQNPGAGAIYVGQIVGPEGRSPEISLEQWSEFVEQLAEDGNFGSKSSIIINQLNSGKEDDEIKAGYINVKDLHGDAIGGFLSFDIPKMVMESEVVNHGAYSTAGVVETPASTSHPHWYKWDFTIPDGKHGRDFSELKIENGSLTNATTDSLGNPIVSNDKYFTYSITDYENGNNYTPTPSSTYHLGRWPYRVIDGITLINDNRSTITWRNGQLAKLGDLYREEPNPSASNYNDIKDLYWICIKSGIIVEDDEIAHDSSYMPAITSSDQIGYVATGLQYTEWRVVNIPLTAPAHSITVAYTAGLDDLFEKVLRSVDHLSVDKEGNLYAFYSDDINKSYYLTNIGGMKNGTDDNDRGVIVTDDLIVFYFYNGTEYHYPLKQILSIDFYIGTPQKDQYNEWMYDSQGKLIFDDYTQDSILKIRYKDNTMDTFEIKRIDSINFRNRDLTTPQNFEVMYKGYSDPEIVNEVATNTVVAIGRKGDNILILYSDPEVRSNIALDKKVIIPSWTDPVTGIEYSNLEWYNYGQLGAQYHIQGEYDISDLKGDSTDPNFTVDLSEGFTGDLADRMGWLVTVTDGNNNKHLYAFDYNDDLNDPSHLLYDSTPSCWYEIMLLSASMIEPSRIVTITPIDSVTPSPLVNNGILFIISYGHDEEY